LFPGTDFLPYKCSSCDKWYCGPHRVPSMHECPVNFAASAGAGAASEKVGTATTATTAAPPKHKSKCTSKGCKTVLTMVNTTTCSRCLATVCLRHRHPSDHGCAGSVAPILPSLHLVRPVDGSNLKKPTAPYSHMYCNPNVPISSVGVTVLYSHPSDGSATPRWRDDAICLLRDLVQLHDRSFVGPGTRADTAYGSPLLHVSV
jgi:hypothetical protein